MADRIKIRKAPGTWSVRVAGAVVAETKNALELSEEGYGDVIYVPRADFAMAFLDPSEKKTTCPFKGEASYFHIVTKSGTLENAVWSYETPIDEVAEIAEHLAFGHDAVTVEKI